MKTPAVKKDEEDGEKKKKKTRNSTGSRRPDTYPLWHQNAHDKNKTVMAADHHASPIPLASPDLHHEDATQMHEEKSPVMDG